MSFFLGKDFLNGAQFTREEIDHVITVAVDMLEHLKIKRGLDLAKGLVMGSLFFESSTRTRLSFETAMHRLGGSVVGFAEAKSTSTSKGESFTDTIRTVDQYVDLIVLRHPEIGSASIAAEVAEAPVINGGDGSGQHPTQALLDLFTIQSECGTVDGKSIVLCGDLKHGRTVHAGVELYKHYSCRLIFVSPPQLQMPADLTSRLRTHGVHIEETTDLQAALKQADVVYMTRIQRERFDNPDEYEHLKNSYILTKEIVERIRPQVIVLHPLPRVNEITSDVDELSGAAYFRQVRNGIYTRMAIISLVTGIV